MAPDAAALSQPPHSGTRQDQDAESFGFEKGDLAALVTPPKFDSLEDERQYLKERIALACRIFAQYGLDHHIVSCCDEGPAILLLAVRGRLFARLSRLCMSCATYNRLTATFGSGKGRRIDAGPARTTGTDPRFLPTRLAISPSASRASPTRSTSTPSPAASSVRPSAVLNPSNPLTLSEVAQ